MALIVAALLLTSFAHMAFASRRLMYKKDCPEGVALNPRGDCVDKQTQALTAQVCCKELRWCTATIKQHSDQYSAVIEAFYTGDCSLLPNDVVSENGTFVIVENHRICTQQCQDFSKLQIGTLPKYEAFESRCAGHEGLPKLKDQINFIKALDESRSSCTTTTTTTTTTVTTTTQTLKKIPKQRCIQYADKQCTAHPCAWYQGACSDFGDGWEYKDWHYCAGILGCYYECKKEWECQPKVEGEDCCNLMR